jgi:hypothetical protein
MQFQKCQLIGPNLNLLLYLRLLRPLQLLRLYLYQRLLCLLQYLHLHLLRLILLLGLLCPLMQQKPLMQQQ